MSVIHFMVRNLGQIVFWTGILLVAGDLFGRIGVGIGLILFGIVQVIL